MLGKLFPDLGDSYKLGALCKDLSCTYFIKFCTSWQKSLLEKEVGVRKRSMERKHAAQSGEQWTLRWS